MDHDVKDVLSSFVLRMHQQQQQQRNQMDFGDFAIRSDTTEQSSIYEERDDSWSIIWYIASFSGLIAFFLIVSCSEWCCRLHVRAPRQSTHPLRPSTSPSATTTRSFQISEAPPPAYDLFAPPSYESVHKAGANNAGLGDDRPHEKSEYDVYVVPVHAIRMLHEDATRQENHSLSHIVEDDPPSYISVQMNSNSRHSS